MVKTSFFEPDYLIFVSYSTRDLPWATLIGNALRRTGAGVFIAEYDASPGERLTQAITRKIKDCDLFLLLWSSNSKRSLWVGNEVFLAQAEKKRVLPVVLEEAPPLPEALADIKYLPLDPTDPNRTLSWLKAHVSKLSSEKTRRELGLVAAIFLGTLALFGGRGDGEGEEDEEDEEDED